MKLFYTSVLIALIGVGCSTTSNMNTTPSLVRLGVSTAAGYGLIKYPTAKPALVAASDIICAQAAGTNLAPNSIIAAVQTYTSQTAESTLILNSAFNLYTLVWNSYGSNAVKNSATLRNYLQATCDGLQDALGTSLPARVSRNAPSEAAWPLFR